MLDFNNTEIAFSYKSNAELRNAQLLFNTIKRPALVSMAKIGVNIALAIKFPLGWAVKPTLFKQFVAGETLEECKKYVDMLYKNGIYSTLDYSAESEKSKEGFEQVFQETLRSIDNAKGNEKIAYSVFKPSTLVHDEVLEKASERPNELTETEKEEYKDFCDKFMALCQRAYDNDVRILVDAEDCCFQIALDELTEVAMRKHNKNRAIVFATLQMYRHDRLPYLEKLLVDCKEHNYISGIKFVRGAYMEHERERAKQMGYPDPICKDKPATDANFDAGVKFVIDNIENMELFIGTHNEESNYKGSKWMEEKGLERNDKRIFFSQLLGMSDNISFNLANHGHNVTKYLPYASIKDVLPYLLRRADENTSVAGQTGRELSMLNSEVKRRKMASKK